MKIIAFDPASSTGYTFAELKNNTLYINSQSCLCFDIKTNMDKGSYTINMYKKVKEILLEHKPDKVVVEDYFFSNRFRNGSTVNVELRTAIYMICAKLKIPYTIITPTDWKTYIQSPLKYTKQQKKKMGKNAEKLIIIERLREKYGIVFPEKITHNSKQVKFRYDISDSVGQLIYFASKQVKGNLNIVFENSTPIINNIQTNIKLYTLSDKGCEFNLNELKNKYNNSELICLNKYIPENIKPKGDALILIYRNILKDKSINNSNVINVLDELKINPYNIDEDVKILNVGSHSLTCESKDKKIVYVINKDTTFIFNWFLNGEKIYEDIDINLSKGDILLMNEKASGYDSRVKKFPILKNKSL